MKIWKYLNSELIFLGIELLDKPSLLRFVSEKFYQHGVVAQVDRLLAGFEEREATMSTGIGMGIAIPHTFNPEATQPAIQLIRLGKPIAYDSIDGKPVDIVIALVVPENETVFHLQLLSAISRLCRLVGFLDTVRVATDCNRLIERIQILEEQIAFH